MWIIIDIFFWWTLYVREHLRTWTLHVREHCTYVNNLNVKIKVKVGMGEVGCMILKGHNICHKKIISFHLSIYCRDFIVIIWNKHQFWFFLYFSKSIKSQAVFSVKEMFQLIIWMNIFRRIIQALAWKPLIFCRIESRHI